MWLRQSRFREFDLIGNLGHYEGVLKHVMAHAARFFWKLIKQMHPLNVSNLCLLS